MRSNSAKSLQQQLAEGWSGSKKCYHHLSKRCSAATIPVFLFVGMLVTSWLGEDVTFDQLGYRIEAIAISSIYGLLLLGTALAVLYLWPRKLVRRLRKRYGVALFKGVKSVEQAMAGLFYLFVLMALFFFTVSYLEHAPKLAVLGAILLVFAAAFGCLHKV
ncbi:MAG: hypothetical protein M3A44_03830 [Gammaproteobacteria bacterium]